MIITLIGSGNVGTHLGKRLHQRGYKINQVFSRKLENATLLAQAIESKGINDLTKIDQHADLYIISVHDDAIEKVARVLSRNGIKEKLIVHTSGAASSEVLAPYFSKFGIFYPLQTFSKNRKVRFSNIPICIYAKRTEDVFLLKKLGRRISQKVVALSDEERAKVHVAAVMVNNFTNHLFHLSHSILAKEKIDFDILKPLIQETVLKIQNHTPFEMQTGPARREDEETIKKHLAYLEKFPEYLPIYQLLSKSIHNAYRR